MGDEQTQSWWIRINGQNNMGNIVLSVCYRLSSQEEEVAEAFSNWKKPLPTGPGPISAGSTAQHDMNKTENF